MKTVPLRLCCLFVALLIVSSTAAAPPNDNARLTIVYYSPFTITNCWGPSTAKNLKNPHTETALSTLSERDALYGFLDTRGNKGRINRREVRLLVPAQNGKPEYQVDVEGRVRAGDKEYQLTPAAFLRLSELLSVQTPGFIKNRLK